MAYNATQSGVAIENITSSVVLSSKTSKSEDNNFVKDKENSVILPEDTSDKFTNPAGDTRSKMPQPFCALSGTYHLGSRVTNAPYSVTASAERITCRQSTSIVNNSKSEVITVDMKDIIGCKCESLQESSVATKLTIYSCGLKKKFGSKQGIRQTQTLVIVFDQEATIEENSKIAESWKSFICSSAYSETWLRKTIASEEGDSKTSLDVAISNGGHSQLASNTSLLHPTVRPLYILINPFSGRKKALTILNEKVVPMLTISDIAYEAIVTDHAGHAAELILALKLPDWSGIVVVSGDGLLFEVINGLMSRPDWQIAIKMPVGMIPGGSGNAMISALLFAAGETYLENAAFNASFMLTKHVVMPMDLIAVDTSRGKRLYSFLSIGWGIISDVDVESERFRVLGGNRFSVGAFIRFVNLRKYPGRLSFLPVDDAFAIKAKKTKRSKSVYQAPSGDQTAKVQRSLSTQEQSFMTNAVSMTTNGGSVKTDNENEKTVEATSTAKTSNGPSNLQDVAQGSTSSDDVPISSPVTHLLSPLDQPVPTSWVTVEDEFIFVVAVYQSHLAADMIPVPHCRIDDGVIHLHFMRGSESRAGLVSTFIAMGNGTIPDNANLDIVRVKAFRLEPLTSKGLLTVDGEVVDYGPIQAQVLPSMARVMGLPSREK